MKKEKKNKTIFKVLLVLITVVVTFEIFAYLIYGSYFSENGDISNWFHVLIAFMVFILFGILNKFKNTHGKEYQKAHSILLKPKNTYGIYALIFFVLYFVSYLLFIFISKI